MILYVICPSVRLRNWLPRDLRNSRRMRETLGANPDLGSGWCVSAISRGGDGFECLSQFCDFMGFTSWNCLPNLQFWLPDMEYHCIFLLCGDVYSTFYILSSNISTCIPLFWVVWDFVQKCKNYDLSKNDAGRLWWRYQVPSLALSGESSRERCLWRNGRWHCTLGPTRSASGRNHRCCGEDAAAVAGGDGLDCRLWSGGNKGIERRWMMLNGRQIDKKQHLTRKIIGMVSQYGYWFITRSWWSSCIFQHILNEYSRCIGNCRERSLGALLQIMVVAISIAFVLLTQIQLKNVFKKLLWTLLVKILGVPDISWTSHG